MSSLSYSTVQNRISSSYNNEMPSSSAYSFQLPYLGMIPLGKSPPNLASFQKPLRELYLPYYRQRREHHYDERRIIISDRDILIFEPDAVSKGKRALIYSNLESIVDIQAVELYLMFNQTENHHYKRIRAAFLPIGCEHQERFRSLYATIDKSQYNLLSAPSPSSCHPPLLIFVMKKVGTNSTCSLLDCHVFVVRRESLAFDLCDMIRKLIIKRTMSPRLSTPSPQSPPPPPLPPPLPLSVVPPQSSQSTTTLLRVRDNIKEASIERRTKYLNRDRPISAMEHRQADMSTNNDKREPHSISNSNFVDVVNSPSKDLAHPLSSSSFHINNNQQAYLYQDSPEVLNTDNGIHRMASTCSTPIRTLSTRLEQKPHQRHFIKASSSSSLALDESDEVVNDLMNIVVAEKLKTIDTNSCQISIKRHASFDQSAPAINDNTMNKKRHQYPFHNNQKKRSFYLNSNPLPTILSANNTPVISRTTTNAEQSPSQPPQSTSSIIDHYLLRPQVVINRYGDIGNYVPKLLRQNAATSSANMRSSDSNENIFFRANNGHLLNGFLNLDFSSKSQASNRNNNNNNNNDNNNNSSFNHHYSYHLSSPCLNEDSEHERNPFLLIQQLKKNQTKCNDNGGNCKDIHIENGKNEHRAPSSRASRIPIQPQSNKPIPTAIGGIKVLPIVPISSRPSRRPLKLSFTSSPATAATTKPRRVASFTIADTPLPTDYRQYLRHTDKGVQLYGEEQQQEQSSTTLEHSLGYFP